MRTFGQLVGCLWVPVGVAFLIAAAVRLVYMALERYAAIHQFMQ